MSKLIALFAIVGAVLLPAAGAATTTQLAGVVVSKDTARHTAVIASSHDTLTTVRATAKELKATKVGSRISVAGTALPDGSLHATSVKRSGAAKQAHIRVTVLDVRGSTVLVAGGGSSFAIRFPSTKAARVGAARRSGGGLQAGDEISTDVELSHGHATGDATQTVGQSNLIDFSGKVTAFDSTSLTVANDGVSTVVAIPDGVTLPPLVQVGSEVEVVASVSGATLTLVEIKLDGDGAKNGDDGGSNVDGNGTVHVEGFVTSLDSASITIQPGDNASPVTFTIPDGFSLPSGLAAGSRVEARGDVVSSVLTLTRLELNSGGGDSGEVETEGTVTALDSGSVTIQPADSGTPLTFAIPDGFTLPSGLQVGSLVDAKGDYVSNVLTLTKLELQDGGGDGGDGGGNG